MQSSRQRLGPLKLGSVTFLFLALGLAVASGDVLLVLAVSTAAAGILLLTTQRGATVRRPAALPVVAQEVEQDRPRFTARSRRSPHHMAVRRYRVTTILSRRAGQTSQEARADAPHEVAARARVARATR